MKITIEIPHKEKTTFNELIALLVIENFKAEIDIPILDNDEIVLSRKEI